MDGVGINDNGLGSAGDLPALAVKEETIAPFRRSMGGEGGLVGKSAVTAAVAAVQQNLARMEKVRDRPRALLLFRATDILPLRASISSDDPVAKNENLPRASQRTEEVFS
jgi:hypothetical protein